MLVVCDLSLGRLWELVLELGRWLSSEALDSYDDATEDQCKGD